jgi:hypothetical protein
MSQLYLELLLKFQLKYPVLDDCAFAAVVKPPWNRRRRGWTEEAHI